ncbi:hypothetical protein HK405_011992, partial [Cladochytrium tenue]
EAYNNLKADIEYAYDHCLTNEKILIRIQEFETSFLDLRDLAASKFLAPWDPTDEMQGASAMAHGRRAIVAFRKLRHMVEELKFRSTCMKFGP